MRSAFLILGTLVLLAGGFSAYWVYQSRHAGAGQDASAATTRHAPTPIQDGDSTYQVRGGQNVWLKEFDAERRLTNQFRAAQFDPQKEGFVRVTKPEAHFFLKGGQWIRVTGKTGDVYVSGMPEAGSSPFAAGGGGMSAAPSRGHLKDVHLQLYETAESTTPTLDMEMNNAAFDNENFRIFTEGYTDASGKQIAADEVKVTVRGKYEFDGRGLQIRWNDRDRRLELLEVAHGERLVVKEPGELGTAMPGGTPSTSAAPRPADRGPEVPRPGRESVSSGDAGRDTSGPRSTVDPTKAGPAAAAAASAMTASSQGNDSTLYSIWFHDNVQVVQADKTLASGNVVEVFYAMRESQPKPTAAPAPAAEERPAAAPQPAATAPAPVSPATAPADAAVQPAQQPIVVYWTGKLRIVPSSTEPPAPLAPGESAIQMRGSPVVLTRDNVQIRCPGFTYTTADGGVTLNNSEAFPQVEIAQFATPARDGEAELTLLSERVNYAPDQGIATLSGKSRAVFPADQTGKSDELAQAFWTREGVARFSGGGSETVIQSLDLTGDVDVQHPQMSLKSARLNLAFDPPAPAADKPAAREKPAGSSTTTRPSATSRQPVVRQVTADGAVHCELLDEDGALRELHGEHLVITTATDPAGRLYPKLVEAHSNVRAVQEGQELTAQELKITLAPAVKKKPDPKDVKNGKPARDGKVARDTSGSASVELQRLEAKTNVRAVSKDGEVATGDTLVVLMTPSGTPQVGLSGRPANVTNAEGTVLTSAKIVIPNREEAQALGNGSLRTPVSGSTNRLMDVTWTGSALLNNRLKEDQVQLVGQVKVRMPDDDGAVNTASAERMLITLADKPAEPGDAKAAGEKARKPSTRPAARRGGAQPTGTLAATDVDVMKDKQVSRILLNKDAVVDSRLAGADGSVLREMRIDSSLVQFFVQARRLVVPRPGRMIVRDHRPPEPDGKPEATGAGADQDGLSTQRGATAFQWAEGLDYNGAEQRATMKGDVLVVYKPDNEGEPPVRLRADEVVTTFEEATAKPATEPVVAAATKPKGAIDMKAPSVTLRSVRAEGNVNVLRGTEELTAPRLTYDPVTHWIRAVGSPQTPAVFSNGGRNSTSARGFQWNTQTWQMRVEDAAGRAAGTR